MSIAPLTLPRLDGELEVGGQDLVRERLHDARGVVPEQCRDVDDRTCHAAQQNSTAVDPCKSYNSGPLYRLVQGLLDW